jgi:taurine dioxygenase
VVHASVLQRSIKVERLTCSIGAEISNVSLATAAVDDVLLAEIRALLLKHRVLFLRDQDSTRAEHVACARRFGELEDHPVAGSDPDHPGLVRIYKSLDSKKEHYENAFHCDATWRECPPFGCVLRCVETPEVGGDTLFANMIEAYEQLSEPVKALVRTLTAMHDGALPWKTIYGIDPKPGTTYPRHVHPVVIRHPDTGRDVLFVNRGFTTHLTGVSAQESRFLLEMLFNHIEASPQIHCRVQWRPNTLVMWDNVATQHHAVWDYFPHSRYAERVSSLGVELSAAA